jgi:phosphate transport system permease protein
VTTPWVRGSDAVARVLITAGGIGTIIAVLLVCVFLLAVAIPLFKPARIEPAGPPAAFGDDAADAVRPSVHLGTDESGIVGFRVRREGAIDLFSTRTGRLLRRVSAEETGLAGVTAIRVLPGSLDAVVGFEDGSHAIGRLGLESGFLSAADLPDDLRNLKEGDLGTLDDALVLRPVRDQYARVRLVTELGERVASESGVAVVDVDMTRTAGGPLVVVLDADGATRVASVSQRRNLLTDEVVSTIAGATIEPDDKGASVPAFVRVSELGDQMFLVSASGALTRHDIKRPDAPRKMESVRVVPEGRLVTAVARLFGGLAVAIGDDSGRIGIWFLTRDEELAGRPSRDDRAAADGMSVVSARIFEPVAGSDAVTAIAPSPRSRLFASAHASGRVRLVHSTANRTVAATSFSAPRARSGRSEPRDAPGPMAISSRENLLIAEDGESVEAWRFDAGYPEVTLGTLFGRVWYERYPAPVHAWETTGHESFEAKFSLVPLVFGTVKATLYSMLFATPIAILAAIYSSQFMDPAWRARVKPTIEMMASLPSVVLGFVAGLVFAPAIESALMAFLIGFVTVPLAIVAMAHLWMLLPPVQRIALARYRFAAVLLGAIPAGVVAAISLARPVERVLFGDLRAWLDGQGGSGFGGWVLLLLPISAVAVVVAMGRVVTPAIRRRSGGWSPSRAALASLATFIVGAVATVFLAVAAAVLLDALRFDTRGGLVGTYVQRNALVVAIGMAFAIIPLIFTIADDALSSVPAHLRSASLGAGATPWQTTMRVTVPAAASGLFSAVMIGLGRAVGETMVVLMAAGNTPLIDWNLFNGFQTLSAAIATELPEAARGSGHYRILFLAALTLFVMTFFVNTVAEFVRQRFRRRAHDL